ncbi:MAG: Fic family protein [Candidatus Pacebacteria bacterium]|nr:Fic family protein [Candidatus Paceibacterota bacterium]
MYQPQFTITNKILKNIGLIEAAREVILNAPLIPAYLMKFRKEALNRTVHYGTHLEGNALNLNQAIKVLEGEQVVARERDVQEVINYRRVIHFIDELAKFKEKTSRNKPAEKERKIRWRYTQKMIKKIHALVCERIISLEQQGQYRITQVILRETSTGEVFFRPPPAVEVPYLVEDFVHWINLKTACEIHPVLRAGVAHYVLAAIHPFVEGNGRTARAFATLVLFAERYDIKRFFALEEYFDRDAASYYQALFKVSAQSEELEKRDLTPWLEYFCEVMAIELTQVKERVRRLSLDAKVKSRLGRQIPLNERQIRLMEYLEENQRLKTSQAKKLIPEYSEDTLLRDLNYFVKKGIVKKRGKTKGAVYIMKQ